MGGGVSAAGTSVCYWHRPLPTPSLRGRGRSVLLHAEGLAAFRGERLVFRDLDFAVAAGGALVLAGPNGSGKSTLLRVLAGLGRLAAGQLTWAGEDALADPTAHAARVAYVGHLDAVKPGLTAAENLRFAARVGGGDSAAALDGASGCALGGTAGADAVGGSEAAAGAGSAGTVRGAAVAAR